MTKKTGQLTINQLAPLWPLPKPLLQVIRRALPLELKRLSLQGRRGVCVEQDMAVLEVLLLRAGLQVFFKAVAAVGWRDGRDVDASVILGGGGEGWGLLGGHDGWCSFCFCFGLVGMGVDLDLEVGAIGVGGEVELSGRDDSA